MKIVEISVLANGAHRNQTTGRTFQPPEGWAVIPDGMELENFPFGEIEAEEIDGVLTVTGWTPGAIPVEPPDIEQVRSDKEAELSNACNSAITAGIDVETTQGTEHFALTETDQINLTTAYNAVLMGAAGYPYHADNTMCRMFSADEIKAISEAGIAHIMYHTTLCNHLLTWARRAETVEEIEGITYTADGLPEDLAANMASVLASATSL